MTCRGGTHEHSLINYVSQFGLCWIFLSYPWWSFMTVSLQHRFHPPEVLSCSLHTPPSFTCWLVPLQFPSLYQSCSVHVPVLSILFLLMTLIFAWQRPPQSYWTLVTYCGYALTVGVTKQTDFLVDRFNMLHINACKNRFRSLLKYDIYRFMNS